jgi:hypothetical protein
MGLADSLPSLGGAHGKTNKIQEEVQMVQVEVQKF